MYLPQRGRTFLGCTFRGEWCILQGVNFPEGGVPSPEGSYLPGVYLPRGGVYFTGGELSRVWCAFQQVYLPEGLPSRGGVPSLGVPYQGVYFTGVCTFQGVYQAFPPLLQNGRDLGPGISTPCGQTHGSTRVKGTLV